MKEKRCELVRCELEELTLNQEFSTAAAEHLQSCAGCREFQQQQTKLRQIVGSLGTVDAPADFDFRLRARLAASNGVGFRYWSFAVKSLATAAILVVFGVSVAVLWQKSQPEAPVAVVPPNAPAPVAGTQSQQPQPTFSPVPPPSPNVAPTFVVNHQPKRKVERSLAAKTKPPLSAVEFSSERAPIVGRELPALNLEPVFPIEASVQSLKVSLDDGHGNARTISFPTVSFGSQRVLTTANQFAPKGVW